MTLIVPSPTNSAKGKRYLRVLVINHSYYLKVSINPFKPIIATGKDMAPVSSRKYEFSIYLMLQK
jgi:hypothetical protein